MPLFQNPQVHLLTVLEFGFFVSGYGLMSYDLRRVLFIFFLVVVMLGAVGCSVVYLFLCNSFRDFPLLIGYG